MEIKTIKRPWSKPSKQGNRYNPDPRYQSTRWKKARQTHIHGSTRVTPQQFSTILSLNPLLQYTAAVISNEFCIQCYLEGKLVPMHAVDHDPPVKAGTDFWDHTKYKSLCKTHHASKSANEGKRQPGR